MKRIIWVILAVFLSAGASQAHFNHKGQRGRNFDHFYTSLQSHGEWINVRFGAAWRPFHVDHQWRPYLNGRWIWTDYGWYWSSYEPFGWATYHYGRWTYDDYYGWIWIPGEEWGPAWVEWRYDDDYIGWAPLPPTARWSFSVGITFGRAWIAPVHYWNFVPCGNFSSVSVVNYIQPPDISRRIFGRTRSAGSVRSVNNRVVNDAVRLDRVQRRSSEPIRKVDLVDRNSPGEDRLVRGKDRETMEIYRPDSRDGGTTGSRRSPRLNDTRQAPAVNDAGRPRTTAPGNREINRNAGPRNESPAKIAPNRGNQRSVEESRGKRTYQKPPAEVRSPRQENKREVQQDRPARTQVQKRPSVTTPRPSGRRDAPAPRQSGSKKRKPDG
jgi:hypothetical protein